jgi:hypothetical protein
MRLEISSTAPGEIESVLGKFTKLELVMPDSSRIDISTICNAATLRYDVNGANELDVTFCRVGILKSAVELDDKAKQRLLEALSDD